MLPSINLVEADVGGKDGKTLLDPKEILLMPNVQRKTWRTYGENNIEM